MSNLKREGRKGNDKAIEQSGKQIREEKKI
jgi:hypothetical protein